MKDMKLIVRSKQTTARPVVVPRLLGTACNVFVPVLGEAGMLRPVAVDCTVEAAHKRLEVEEAGQRHSAGQLRRLWTLTADSAVGRRLLYQDIGDRGTTGNKHT